VRSHRSERCRGSSLRSAGQQLVSHLGSGTTRLRSVIHSHRHLRRPVPLPGIHSGNSLPFPSPPPLPCSSHSISLLCSVADRTNPSSTRDCSSAAASLCLSPSWPPRSSPPPSPPLPLSLWWMRSLRLGTSSPLSALPSPSSPCYRSAAALASCDRSLNSLSFLCLILSLSHLPLSLRTSSLVSHLQRCGSSPLSSSLPTSTFSGTPSSRSRKTSPLPPPSHLWLCSILTESRFLPQWLAPPLALLLCGFYLSTLSLLLQSETSALASSLSSLFSSCCSPFPWTLSSRYTSLQWCGEDELEQLQLEDKDKETAAGRETTASNSSSSSTGPSLFSSDDDEELQSQSRTQSQPQSQRQTSQPNAE
jgi:hypothetical protein